MRIYSPRKGEWWIDYFHGLELDDQGKPKLGPTGKAIAKRHRFRSGSSEEATKALRLRIENEIAAGTHNPVVIRQELRGIRPTGATFGSLLDDFLANKATRGGTAYYADISGPLRAFFGQMQPAAIGPEHLTAYVAQRRARRDAEGERKVRDNTIRKELTALSGIYLWARGNRGLRLDNPLVGFKRPPKPGKRRITLLPGEIEPAVLAALPPLYKDMVEWALYSGMRLNEILALRWQDIDRRTNQIHVLSGKTGGLRTIPLTLSVRLTQILGRRPRAIKADSLVFCGPDGKGIDPRDELRRVREAVTEKFELDPDLFNTCRHTFSTRLAASGRFTVAVMAQMTGNTVDVFERHYLGALPQTAEAAAGALDSDWQLYGNALGTV
ncbi:MAG TPA: site-specific integrase [Candidatus Polarisedimenticolia bacterium]|jgi:integrase|nr:site-specific integrase [Candidatus Polarisedimenticolia bacterium]